MRKKISREAKIGIFGISMILLLYLGINYIKSQDLFSRDYTYYAIYDNSDGIESSSPVTIKGYRVGTVDKVWYDIDRDQVIVRFSVKHSYRLPAGTEARITSASLLGSKVIDLNLSQSDIYMSDGDTILSFQERGLAGQLDNLQAQAGAMVDQLAQALVSVNAVLSEDNIANLSGMLSHLNQASEEVNRVVRTDVAQIAGNLQTLTGMLNQTAPTLQGILGRFEDIADSLSYSVPELVTNASASILRLQHTIDLISDPNGTTGKLLTDPELYNNLADASNSLNLLLQDLKQNPGRYLHFSVFGRKEQR